MLETSKLARRLITRGPIEKNAKIRLKGAVKGVTWKVEELRPKTCKQADRRRLYIWIPSTPTCLFTICYVSGLTYWQPPTDARSLCLTFLTCRRRSIVSTMTSYCSDFRLILSCRMLCWGRFSHSWPFMCTLLSLNSWSCVMVCTPATAKFISAFQSAMNG